MGLAAIVIEEHAGAAVQLRHDDALGAVDDEGAVVGHERQFTEVYLLLTHVLDGLLGTAGLLIERHEAYFDAQRGRVSQSAQLAFLDVEHRFAQTIAHVLQRRVAGITGNGEHAVEGGVQADFVAFGLRDIRLQKSPVRIQLDRQQIRRAEYARALAEVLTNALLFGERISHVCAFPGAYAPNLTGPERPRLIVARCASKKSKSRSTSTSKAQPTAAAESAATVGLRVSTIITT